MLVRVSLVTRWLSDLTMCAVSPPIVIIIRRALIDNCSSAVGSGSAGTLDLDGVVSGGVPRPHTRMNTSFSNGAAQSWVESLNRQQQNPMRTIQPAEKARTS